MGPDGCPLERWRGRRREEGEGERERVEAVVVGSGGGGGWQLRALVVGLNGGLITDYSLWLSRGQGWSGWRQKQIGHARRTDKSQVSLNLAPGR